MGMRLPRARFIVSPLPCAGETARLSPEEAAHARARRLRPGDPVVLLDGSGREAEALVTDLDRSTGEVAVERILPASNPVSPVALFVAGLRVERLAWLTEKATELFAESVTLVVSARTQSFRGSAAVRERLDRVAREAAKQCEAARWPRIEGPLPLERALSERPAAHRLFLDKEGEIFPSELSARAVALLVGPEGGWTPAERETAGVQGWSLVALPAGNLRAETAAIAALVLTRAGLARGKL
jgi:16S rRNA (uracil1498-N3)-methyltransferase